MGADVVVLFLEGQRHALGLEEVGEQLSVEALVMKRPLKLSLTPFCHGLPRLDEAGFDASQDQPFLEERGDKLRPVVAPQVGRRPWISVNSESAATTSRAPMQRLATIGQ